MRSYSHLGTGFKVWNRRETWFWVVADPRRPGGSIGAAPSEADALRDARLSIEEATERRRAIRAADAVSTIPTVKSWKGWLANLAQYLAAHDRAAA